MLCLSKKKYEFLWGIWNVLQVILCAFCQTLVKYRVKNIFLPVLYVGLQTKKGQRRSQFRLIGLENS